MSMQRQPTDRCFQEGTWCMPNPEGESHLLSFPYLPFKVVYKKGIDIPVADALSCVTPMDPVLFRSRRCTFDWKALLSFGFFFKFTNCKVDNFGHFTLQAKRSFCKQNTNTIPFKELIYLKNDILSKFLMNGTLHFITEEYNGSLYTLLTSASKYEPARQNHCAQMVLHWEMHL